MPVLVETSAWVDALRVNGDPAVRARVQHLLITRNAAWCEMIRLELWNGARGMHERNELAKMDQSLPRLPITDQVWELARKIATQARDTGLTIPAADILIFACARAHGAPIEHTDKHYDLLDDLLDQPLPP